MVSTSHLACAHEVQEVPALDAYHLEVGVLVVIVLTHAPPQVPLLDLERLLALPEEQLPGILKAEGLDVDAGAGGETGLQPHLRGGAVTSSLGSRPSDVHATGSAKAANAEKAAGAEGIQAHGGAPDGVDEEDPELRVELELMRVEFEPRLRMLEWDKVGKLHLARPRMSQRPRFPAPRSPPHTPRSPLPCSALLASVFPLFLLLPSLLPRPFV